MKKRPTRKLTLVLFAGLALLTTALRFHAFFRSVIDSDESLYLLMADALTKGHLPYTVIFDNKPPGVYFILAASLKTVGGIFGGIFAMRLTTVLFSAATACVLYEIAQELWQNTPAGICAGLFFCVYSVVNGGLAANTEPFFIFFTSFGMLVALRASKHEEDTAPTLRFFGAGLLFGIAFQIKFLAAFDAMAVAAVLFFRPGADLLRTPPSPLRASCALLAGFVCPTIAVVGLYLFAGHFGEYAYSNFTANVIRAQVSPFSSTEFFAGLKQQVEMFPLVWLTFFTALFGCLFFLFKSRAVRFCAIWAVLDLLSIAATKKYYPHYYLQILPPLCLLGGCAFFATASLGKRTIAAVVVAGLTLPICWEAAAEAVAFVDHRWIRHEKDAGDPAALIADDLRARLEPGQWPLIVNADPVIYFLVGTHPPSRFLFPPFLTGQSDLDRVAGIDGAAEITRIMSLGPQIILYSPVWTGRDSTLDAFSDSLDQRYARVAEIAGIMIYRKLP